MEGSSEPMMKYLRLQPLQMRCLEAARTQVHLLRIHVELQLFQYPTARLGPLVMLEDLQDLQPSVNPGQVQPNGDHANRGYEWRKRALRQRARQTGVDSMSSRYFVVSALQMKQVNVVYFVSFTSGGGMLEPPPCNGR